MLEPDSQFNVSTVINIPAWAPIMPALVAAANLPAENADMTGGAGNRAFPPQGNLGYTLLGIDTIVAY